MDVRHGAGRRRPGARPRGEEDRGAAGVRLDSRPARPASGRGPLDPALRLQQPRRPERAAPDDSLAARVRGEVREQARGAVRRESRRGGTKEAARLRHRLLVALLAGAGVAALVPPVRRRAPREARPAHRPEGVAGEARPLRRLHRPGAAAQEGQAPGPLLPVAPRRVPRPRDDRLLALEDVVGHGSRRRRRDPARDARPAAGTGSRGARPSARRARSPRPRTRRTSRATRGRRRSPRSCSPGIRRRRR